MAIFVFFFFFCAFLVSRPAREWRDVALRLDRDLGVNDRCKARPAAVDHAGIDRYKYVNVLLCCLLCVQALLLYVQMCCLTKYSVIYSRVLILILAGTAVSLRGCCRSGVESFEHCSLLTSPPPF